jgi:hypothetical protein
MCTNCKQYVTKTLIIIGWVNAVDGDNDPFVKEKIR